MLNINPPTSKLTNKQLAHYIKGGKFRATYLPELTHDLIQPFSLLIGETMEVHVNPSNAPCLTGNYVGQHMFSVSDVLTHADYRGPTYGQIPECDIDELIIIDEFTTPEAIPVYCYMMTYTERSQLKDNFGVDFEDMPLPYTVGRQYGYDSDERIMKLSSPQATRIDKAIWNPTVDRNLHWLPFYKNGKLCSEKETL